MKIAVCFKVVPRWERVLPEDWEHFTPEIELAYAGEEFNCFDQSALELALRLKEARREKGLPVRCVAVTAGRRPPALFIQTLHAVGFDEVAVLAREKAEFAPRTVARLLAAYLKEERFDLILTGSMAGMADSGTVPLWLAQFLHRPLCAEVLGLEYSEQGIAAIRQEQSGRWRYLVRPPLIITIGNSPAVLRAPTLKARLTAGKKEARLLTFPERAPRDDAATLGFGKAWKERRCRMLPGKDATGLAQTLFREGLLQIGQDKREQGSPERGFTFMKKTVSYRLQPGQGLLTGSLFRQLAEDWLKRRAEIALLPHTPGGRLLATALAARTGAALFTEAEPLSREKGKLVARKRACAGNIYWKRSLPLPAILTLPLLPQGLPPVLLSPQKEERPQWLADSVLLEPSAPEKLQNRDLAIICGLGIGSAAACRRARLLAQKLGADFGLTRPAALEGWGQVDEIIGSSGKALSSAVCLVLGASGAGAFMAGLEAADRIIAANIDERALIFKQADTGLLTDASGLVEAMLENFGKEQQREETK